jgi:2-polyprenyl-3-methyl-5-hydroxy-6-metoxy-1,4-benzoquinol methylase
MEHKYNEIGTEGHNIRAYQGLFEHARDNKE